MKSVLLDTNIIIYSLNGDSRILKLLENLKDVRFCISIITWIETLTGSLRHGKAIDEISWEIDHFQRLPLNEFVGHTSAVIMQQKLLAGKKWKFQDNIIGATAVAHNMPLVTANPKDFRGIKGLKIISLS